MHIARDAQTPIKTRGINHRVGTFRYKDLGEGVEGTPGNYFLRLVWSQADFFSPRHLHNFDQVRVQIEGEFDFASDGVMKPGVIAYFPEGTPYGPQTSQDETLTLVLQIGGASGAGYMSEAQRIAAVEQLARTGRFSEGRYFAPGDTTSTGVDSLQAAWETALGRKMAYPPQRFQKPVFIDPEAIAWQAVHRSNGVLLPGVESRPIWNFGTRTVAVQQLRLAPGATHELEGACSFFVQRGAATLESPQAKLALQKHDAVHLLRHETTRIAASEPTMLLLFIHPDFDDGPASRSHEESGSAKEDERGEGSSHQHKPAGTTGVTEPQTANH